MKKPNQKNLGKYITKIDAAESHRKPYEELWSRLYKRYRNYVEPIKDRYGRVDKDRSNISIPYAFVQVETIHPRIMETVFASRPYVSVKGRERGDLDRAKQNETLLDYQQNERMDFRRVLGNGIKGACIYGMVVGYTGWKYEEKQVIRKELQPVTVDDPETGETIPVSDELGQPAQEYQPVKVNEVTYDDPEVKCIDLGLFYWDPSAEDVNDGRYCGHDEFKTKEELQELHDQGILYIDWKKVPKQKSSNKARDDRNSAIGLPSVNDQIEGDDSLYKVTHYWEDDKHVVIINRGYLALEDENPFWHKKKPYDKACYIDVPGEFVGMGALEVSEDMFDELNAERNMRIDFRKFLLRRMFKVRKGADIDRRQLKWSQGGVIEVKEMDDVVEFGISDVAGSTFMQESSTKGDIQDATGAQDVIMGTSVGKETATTTMTKDNNASMRFRLVVSNIEKNLLVPISRKMMQLNQQFLDDTRVIRVTGSDGNDDWPEISPDEIQGEYDLVACGSSVEPLANKEAYKQRMVELYQVTASDPMLTQFPVKRRNLLKKVFEAFDIKDTDNLLPTDEELAPQPAPIVPPGQGEEVVMPDGGGANTVPMQEMGLPMMGGANIG